MNKIILVLNFRYEVIHRLILTDDSLVTLADIEELICDIALVDNSWSTNYYLSLPFVRLDSVPSSAKAVWARKLMAHTRSGRRGDDVVGLGYLIFEETV